MKWKNIFKETAYISSIHLVTKTLGFLEKLLIAYLFGASSISDAYFFSFAIFILVFDFFNESTSPALLPSYVNTRKTGKEEELFSSAFSFLLTTGILLSLIISFFSGEIIDKLTGFPPVTADIATDYLRIISLGIGFVISSISTYLFINSGKKFLPAALGDLFFKVTGSLFILYALIDKSIGLLSLAVGILAGSMLKLLTHVIYLKGRRVSFKLSFNKSFFSVFKLSLPVLAGVLFSKGRVLFDNLIVSGMAVGSITAMQLGYRVMEFLVVVLIEPFSTVLFPEFVSVVKKMNVLREKISGSIKFLMVIFIPISFFAFVFRHQIITLLFKRGAFDEGSVALTASAFSFYVLSMIFISLDFLFSRVLFSYGDTKFPPLFEIISIVFHMIFVLLFKSKGIYIISLAFMLNRVTKSILLYLRLRLILKFGKDVFRFFIKLILTVTVAAIFSYISGSLFSDSPDGYFSFFLSGFLFFLFYITGLALVGIITDIFSYFKNR